ncbi:peptide-methionine (S)-S-oxide reductase MsrA [soil metagenome]
MNKVGLLVVVLVMLGASGIFFWNDSAMAPAKPTVVEPTVLEPAEPEPGKAKATFASGCFWCTDAVFRQLKGVSSVVSGYSGGTMPNPTYADICTGLTGHAEAVQVTYDPKVISYPELLEVFWKTHDPTTPDQQGPDHGPQYRSVVFYHTDDQKKLAEQYKAKLDKGGVFNQPIVTQIVGFKEFYRAEEDHQNYYAANKTTAYCQVMIGPKIKKIHDLFKDKLIEGAK